MSACLVRGCRNTVEGMRGQLCFTHLEQFFWEASIHLPVCTRSWLAYWSALVTNKEPCPHVFWPRDGDGPCEHCTKGVAS